MLDFGLYRDEGLAAHDKIGERNIEKIRQGLHQLFKSFGLKITIEPPNIKIVNFLDVKLNITSNTFYLTRSRTTQQCMSTLNLTTLLLY